MATFQLQRTNSLQEMFEMLQEPIVVPDDE